MKVLDVIQENDIRVLRVLYGKWKQTHQDRLAYDAEPYDIVSIYQAAGLPKDQFQSHLKNLQNIEFLSYDGDMVKLLPSGINYCLGQFDSLRH